MDVHRDVFEPGPPNPPPGVPPDGMRVALVWMGALIAGLLIILIIVLLTGDDGTGIAADTSTTEAQSTSEPATATTSALVTTVAPATTAGPATTVAPPTTAAPTTTAAPATTAAPTTTNPPFTASTVDKTCPEPDPNTMGGPLKVSDIQFTKFDDFTRIIFFDDAGQVAPGCFVGYVIDQLTLSVMFFPVSTFDPFAAGIFDGGGYLSIGVGSVLGIDSGGQGGGSGEWFFEIDLDSFRAFNVSALAGPTRLIIDIGD